MRQYVRGRRRELVMQRVEAMVPQVHLAGDEAEVALYEAVVRFAATSRVPWPARCRRARPSMTTAFPPAAAISTGTWCAAWVRVRASGRWWTSSSCTVATGRSSKCARRQISGRPEPRSSRAPAVAWPYAAGEFLRKASAQLREMTSAKSQGRALPITEHTRSMCGVSNT